MVPKWKRVKNGPIVSNLVEVFPVWPDLEKYFLLWKFLKFLASTFEHSFCIWNFFINFGYFFILPIEQILLVVKLYKPCGHLVTLDISHSAFGVPFRWHTKMPKWEVVVAQLVERSLPIPEVRGSNPVIGKNLLILNICILSTVYWKTKIKKKRPGMALFLKKKMPKDSNQGPTDRKMTKC